MEMAEGGEEERWVTHSGGCHCRRVRWEAKALARIVCWDCNCSVCHMRQNKHFIVPSAHFHLDPASEDSLTLYTFGTHKAKHLFCKVCGISSFYVPRSNPDGVAITLWCVDPGTVESVEMKSFDGQNWEDSYDASNIAAVSKG